MSLARGCRSREHGAESVAHESVGDVHAVIGSYLHRREEVDAYLEQQEEPAILSRRKHELRSNQSGVRERSLAGRARVVS